MEMGALIDFKNHHLVNIVDPAKKPSVSQR